MLGRPPQGACAVPLEEVRDVSSPGCGRGCLPGGAVNRRGVIYDVGHVYGRGVLTVDTRPDFDARTTHRELEIIKNDLHCNAVRIRGRDIGRLMITAADALAQDLEVWLSADLFDGSPAETVGYLTAAATAAERLRRQWPGRLVFSVGSESTLFMQGIVPGKTLTQRVAHLFADVKSGRHIEPLRAFLTQATESVRPVFQGPLTYAALPFEPVDWSLFDIVGIDHYRDDRVKANYVERLGPFLASGKPVVITEFGMRTYEGAESSGALGFGIVDNRSLLLHHLPVVGHFVRARLKKGPYVRDEGLQARELAETLAILDGTGVDGAFVCTFAESLSTYSADPRYDLDMSALSLVKTYAGARGVTYPDMRWEPKESFWAVADFYGRQGRPPGQGH
jgi:hypothetical protein